jgi:uncharacterized membrane protein HdeD (DUF308 family)
MSEYTAFPDESQFVTESPDERLARHWGVLLAVGIVTFTLGAVLSVWPRETVVVLAVLLALQLVISGCAQLFLAIGAPSRQGAARWATALAGAVAVVVGVLLFFSPLQSLTFIGWAVGLCVLTVGAADLIGALLPGAARHRVWHVIRGILGVAAGLFLVANPDKSLGLLVVIACVWLISYGFFTIVAALLLRSEARRKHDAQAAEGPEAPADGPEAPPAPA